MPLGNIIKGVRKMYDAAEDMDEEPLIPSMGKRNSMPTTSTRVSAKEAAAKSAPAKTAPKRRADPNDAGRVMESMGMGAGKAANTLNRRKKMLEE
jgi:hypothetical protein